MLTSLNGSERIEIYPTAPGHERVAAWVTLTAGAARHRDAAVVLRTRRGGLTVDFRHGAVPESPGAAEKLKTRILAAYAARRGVVTRSTLAAKGGAA